MGISNYYDVEICSAPSGNYQKNVSPLKCLKSVLMRILLACYEKGKKKSKHQKQNTIPILFLYLTRINLLLLFWVLFFSCLMCFYGSKLSLSAIYKNVNSKLYLLRMSSFLIYIYTIVHLIYFFYTVLNTQTYFAVHGIFILFSWICFPILFSLVSITGWISQKN